MYNQRTLENTIEKLSTEFPAIVIYGPRQCGKTTRVNHLFQKRRRSVTLDDPEDLSLALNNPKLFLDTYINGWFYLEKDIRQLISAGNETAFLNFLSYVALRTGQEIRYEEISSSVGIDVKTVKRWLLILQTSGIIVLLQPFRKNTSNRIIKAPKRYFMDTGLSAYLCKWPNAERLEKGVRAGAFFETFVVSELIKNFQFHGLDYRTSLFYYRDTNQKEVDVLFVKNQEIYPIEIKKESIRQSRIRNLMS